MRENFTIDQSPISPVASPEILHHTVWRTWLFIAYSDERLLHYQSSLPHPYISLEEGWENVLFELGSERVNHVERVGAQVVNHGKTT